MIVNVPPQVMFQAKVCTMNCPSKLIMAAVFLECVYIGKNLCFIKEIIWKLTEFIVDVIPVFLDIKFICGFENVMAMTICMMKPGIAFCLDCVNWFFIGGGRFLSHPGCVQSLRRHNLHLEVQLGILPQFNIGASLEEHNFYVPGVVLISSRSFTCFRKPLCWVTFSIMIRTWLSLRCMSAFYTSAYYHTECTGVNEFYVV